MVNQEIVISNKLGLHARASSKLVALASQFTSKITLTKNNRTANVKSIMGLMMLAANMGSTVTLQAEGIDEVTALTAVVKLFNDKFGEEE
jgi:phosphocarrier protein